MVAGGGTGAKRKRVPPADVRARMLQAARHMISDAGGLTVSLTHVNYEEIISRAGVSRSAAYRQWPYKEEFLQELLVDLASAQEVRVGLRAVRPAFDEATLELGLRVVLENRERLGTSAGRHQVLRLAVQQAVALNLRTLVASTEWRTFIALTATVMSTPDAALRQRLLAALSDGNRGFIQTMAPFYSVMAGALGLRLRPPYTFEHIAAMGAAIVEGLALQHILDHEVVREPLLLDAPPARATDGPATEEWSLAAAALFAFLLAALEDLPAADYCYPEWLDAAAASPQQGLQLLLGKPERDPGPLAD